jgi:Tfp pilus assembly protein PilF
MNPLHDNDREQRDDLASSPNSDSETYTLNTSFDSLITTFNRLSDEERRSLANDADSAELGHDAYDLGRYLLNQGDAAAAARWLEMALRHGVDDAQPHLKRARAGNLGKNRSRADSHRRWSTRIRSAIARRYAGCCARHQGS